MTSVQLPRSTPEAQGIPSTAVLHFLNSVEQTIEHLHSFMLMRHGHVVAEGWWAPYAAEKPHVLFSLSKSFTATAIGMALAEGLLTLDDPIVSFFPEDAPAEVSANLAAMRVRHLLMMGTGHAVDTTPALQVSADGNWVRAFLACPVEHPPATHFLYNTGATYMLSAILQKLTGITLLEYLQPRLLTPLGIEGAPWQTCPRGINTGGYGLSTPTEAIANFGQLYLQEGMWQGAQLLPREWIAEATRSQILNGDDPASDWAQGYGYQFWRCRHNAYRGDGAFGQYCVVMPEQDLVVAITGGLDAMQPVLDLVWEHLLPACGPTPLTADPATQAALVQKLEQLVLPLPQGLSTPAAANQHSQRVYHCAPNEQGLETISLDFTGPGCLLTLRDPHGEHRISLRDGIWQPGATTLMSNGSASAIAAAGAWIDATAYRITLYYVETPFCVTLTCRFVDDQLLFDSAVNVSFGPMTFPQIVGHATPYTSR